MSTTNATVYGRLTKDPVTRDVGGTTKCEFSVAVDDGWDDNEHTSFIDCVAWDKTGDTIARYLHKGRQVVVVGEIRQDRWKAQDGSGRSKTYVKVRSFSFVSDGSGKGSNSGGRREVSSDYDTSFEDEEIPF